MKTILTLILLLNGIVSFAQVTPGPKILLHQQPKSIKKDTTIESDTSKENQEPRYFYATLSTNAFVNTKGGFAKRFAPALEIGRTYGIFDIGLATGRLNSISRGGDTSHYLELRPTINVFSKGRFAEALCLGGGMVFGAKQGFMSEICNSINFNITETVAVAMLQGYEFFDGTNSNRSTQYIGLAVTYNFLKPHSVNKQRKKTALVSDK